MARPQGRYNPQDTLPPLDIGAEQSVLGSLIIDPDAYFVVSGMLDAEDFWRETHCWIYKAISELYQRNEPADFVTLCAELEKDGPLDRIGGAAYITQLINEVPSAAYAQHYAEIVKDMANRRRVIDSAGDLVIKAWDTKNDLGAVLSDHIAEVSGHSLGAAASEPELIQGPLSRLFDIVAAGGLPSFATGFRDLDKIFRGGLHPGHLYVYAARPGIGKTAWMLNMAFEGAKKYKVKSAFFSLEMSKEELAGRLMSIAGEVPNDVFVDPDVAKNLTEDNWAALLEIGSVVQQTGIVLDDTAGIYLGELYAKIRRLKALHDIQVVYVDYLQLIRVNDSFQSRTLEVGHISAALKRIARELKIAVVAASQMSRAVEGRVDGKPVLSDLRESGSIEQDSDAVVFLYREDLVKQNSARKGIVDLIIAKNRHGPTDTVSVYYRGEYFKFYNLEQLDAPDGVPSNLQTTQVSTVVYAAPPNSEATQAWEQDDMLDILTSAASETD